MRTHMAFRPFRAILCAVSLVCAAYAQTNMSNADLIKLVKSGLSDDFILNLVDQQGSRLSSDVSSLIELRDGGVGERILTAVVKKNPPREKLNSDSIVRLARAGFSDDFITEIMARGPGSYSVDTSRIVELRKAGVSERILSMMVVQGGGRELARGSEIHVRMIDSVDSEKSREGEEFRASLEEPITVGNDVVVPRGADATVRLVADKASGKLTGKAELTVQLASLTVDGKTVPVSTSSVSEYSGSRGARTAKSAVAVGAIGAVIGAIAGGGKGAAIGASTGAAAGAGAQVFMKGQRVRIPSETVLTFTTEGPVRLP
jgi:hypothetical protein